MAAALAALSAFGQQSTSETFMSGWGPNSAYNHLYSLGKDTTVSGKITRIQASRKPLKTMSPAAELTIRESDGKTEDVQLGPSWYLRNLGTHLAVGNTVTVAGSEIDLNGNNALLARKLTRGNHVLYLRDLNGYPVWVASRPVPRSSTTVASNQTGSTIKSNPREGDSPFGPVADSAVAPPSNQPAPPPPTNLQGSIRQVVNIPNPQTGVTESYMILDTPQGQVNIDLGPQWYIGQQGIAWTPGSDILVNGNPVPGGVLRFGPAGPGNVAYYANGLTYGNQSYVLRSGPFSLWNPWY